MENTKHKAGFVNIIGNPNVGKSTLMNALVGEKLSIITPKAQTTRHRIMGIVNGEDFQIVYSDTPGILKPNYKLQQSMMDFVHGALKDADIILYVTDATEEEFLEEDFIHKLKTTGIPIILLINKIDAVGANKSLEKVMYWKKQFPKAEVMPVSALQKLNTDLLLQKIISLLPEHPAYFDKEELTDKTERFFSAEIIREKILMNCHQEIPYSSEVVVTEFIDEPKIIRIRAEIVIERDSQKGIIIGHKGALIKKIGTEARIDIESFTGKKVFLELFVKVDKDWRNNESRLKQYGYSQ